MYCSRVMSHGMKFSALRNWVLGKADSGLEAPLLPGTFGADLPSDHLFVPSPLPFIDLCLTVTIDHLAAVLLASRRVVRARLTGSIPHLGSVWIPVVYLGAISRETSRSMFHLQNLSRD